MEQTNQLNPLWWHGELKALHVLITIHYMTTISIYDVPQMQQEPLHSLFNYLNTLQAYTPSTAKRKYNYSEKGHSTRLQNTVCMVSYPRSQHENSTLLLKNSQNLNFYTNQRIGWKTRLPTADLLITMSFYCIRKRIEWWKKMCMQYM